MKRLWRLVLAVLAAIGLIAAPAAADDGGGDEFPGQRQGGGTHVANPLEVNDAE